MSDLSPKIHHAPGELAADVWIIHAKRQVLLTDIPGPPAEICGPVRAEAEASAKKRGYATVSEIGFPSDCFVGSWPMPLSGWGEARKVAQAKALELGYDLKIEAMSFDEEEEEEL